MQPNGALTDILSSLVLFVPGTSRDGETSVVIGPGLGSGRSHWTFRNPRVLVTWEGSFSDQRRSL